MKRFIEGQDRAQSTLFPEYLEDWIGEDNSVRAIDVFVQELDLSDLGFGGVDPEATGRPSYHPSVLLKLYIYGYLNRVQSSRRLEREAGRNVEVMWLTGRLVPDHKTIADFRKDNGGAIRRVCARFVALCRSMGLFAEEASVAIDGSKNNRDKNFTGAARCIGGRDAGGLSGRGCSVGRSVSPNGSMRSGMLADQRVRTGRRPSPSSTPGANRPRRRGPDAAECLDF
jgi:transposase